MSQARNFADLLASGTKLTVNKLDDNAIHGNRNLIINGGMNVSQRGTSFSYAHDGSPSPFCLDRFKFILSTNNDQLDGTITQASDGPAGFANSLKWTTGTAETTIDANESLYLEQKIEAQNLQHLEYGASTAKAITLSFYVKSSVTGTFTCGIYAGDTARIIGSTYTINSANTWERKTITFAGDTGGTINNDTGEGLRPVWNLAVGSDFTSVDNSSWAAYTGGSNWAYGHAQNALATTASATWQLTGVQLEVGEATPFEHRSFADELARCQRYYYRIDHSNTSGQIALGWQLDSDDIIASFHLPQPLRASPTISFDKVRIHHNNGAEEGNFTCNNIYLNQNMLGLNLDTSNSPFSTDQCCAISVNNNGYLEVIAEL